MTNCENNSLTQGISMHYFPKDETLRKKWTLLVGVHRKDFVPSKSATLCSVHFDQKCFETKPVLFTCAETGKAIQPKRYLIKGSVPTRYVVVPHSSPITSRKCRGKEESDMEEQAFPGMEEGQQEEQAESSSDQEWEEDDRRIHTMPNWRT
ncbi:uncharacterized protein [Montipora foliosa]|uniref:uncharacterized protein n=1 Tax=Montipora foliosa TaxID=591990 RepID=UPI0035F104B8